MLTLEKLPVDWHIFYSNNERSLCFCVIDSPKPYGIVTSDKTSFGAIAKALKEYREVSNA